MNKEIQEYNNSLLPEEQKICQMIYKAIEDYLPGAESKLWHGQPVWFLDGNPVVGYSKAKNEIKLLFWSGQSFYEPLLKKEGKHKAASYSYNSSEEIDAGDLERWIKKSGDIQWDYKKIAQRKGVLEKLKGIE